jgi:hypothetical protein
MVAGAKMSTDAIMGTAERHVRAMGKRFILFSGVPSFSDGEALLFDSRAEETVPAPATFTGFSLRFEDAPPESLDRELEIQIFLDDLTVPRASVRLSDLVRAGGERPLNLRRRSGQLVRIVLCDPNDVWAADPPRISIALLT